MLRRDWRGILRVIALRIVESFAYYSTATYLLSHISDRHPDVRSVALGAITAASILAIGVTFAAGSLTDRIGRRPIYIAGCVTAIAFGFPMYLLTEGGNPVLVVAVFVFGIGVIHASLTGAQGSLLTEQFRTSTRTSGASIGYQIAAVTRRLRAPARRRRGRRHRLARRRRCSTSARAVIGLIGILVTRETWGPKERAEVEALLREEDARSHGPEARVR